MGSLRRSFVLALLLVSSSSWAADPPTRRLEPTTQRQRQYSTLYQRGVLRGDTLLKRYADKLGTPKQAGKDGPVVADIKLHRELYSIPITPGKRARVRFGTDATQIDHTAHVLQVDAKGGRAEVVALERTANGMRRTQRWVPLANLGLPNVEETWPDGTRVLAGPALDGMHVMVVDRANDPALRRFLDGEVRPLWDRNKQNPRAAVTAVARMVRQKLEYNMDTDDDVSDDEVLLGDYLSAGNGVCRNYAAIAKVALDSLGVKGLKTRYISGQARDKFAFTRGMHAWLEVTMPDGQRMAIDPTWMDTKAPAGGKGPGELAPISEFYKDHQHVPLYSLRALYAGGAANTNAAAGPTPAAPPGLRLTEVAPTVVGTERSTFEARPAGPRTGVVLPRGGLTVGRKLAWRFDTSPHAVDVDAEITEVDLAGGRVKIKAAERVKRKLQSGSSTSEGVSTAKAERWVSVDAVRASVDVVDGRAPVTVGGVRVDRAGDAPLAAFLAREIAPLAASTSEPPRKVTRALGKLREAWKKVGVTGGAAPRTVGEVFGATRVGDRPYAAAGLAIIQALAMPGVEVRVVSGTKHDRDLGVRAADTWLELEVTKGQAVTRYGVDPRKGTVEPLAKFYQHHEYAPDYAQPAVSSVAPVRAAPRSVAAR